MSGDDDKIYKQIETTANTYEPAVYDLLTFYQSIDLQSESLDGRFLPLTTVQQRSPKDTKVFAVGLIPPSARVTHLKLDRTATIKASQEQAFGTYIPVDPKNLEASDDSAEVSGNLSANDKIGVAIAPSTLMAEPRKNVTARSERLVSGLHESVQPLAQKLIEAAAQEGINITLVQGNRTNAEQDAIYAQGRTTPGPIVSNTKGGESWHNFGLAFDVAIISSGPKPPAGKVTFPPDKAIWQRLGALGQQLGMTWGGGFSTLADYGHFEFHPGITKDQARAGARPGATAVPVQPIVDTAAPAREWKKTGSDNAQETSRITSINANKSINREEMGRRFMEAQQAAINALSHALEVMAYTPPLRLLVNPQSFRVSAEKLISDGNWGRNGPIIEHWGENQDKIEGSGKIAAFYSMDSYDATGPGLTRTARQFSQSYQNLLSLSLLYRNNGGVYLPDPTAPAGSRNQNLTVVGSVYLYYDEILYIGSFDSLSITEDAANPFSLEYSFSFTVRAWYLLEHMDDPQYMYGQPQPAAPPVSITVQPTPTSGGNNEQPSPNVPLPPRALPAEVESVLDSIRNNELLIGLENDDPLTSVG
jgi:peptidoglycan LD-endopeptidase CwlK